MKKWLMWIVLLLVLGACSPNKVDEAAVYKYKQERPLEVDISIPAPIMLNEVVTLSAILHQNGEVVENLDHVIFTVWKEGTDSSVDAEKMIAKAGGDGIYSIQKEFDEEGYYYLKVQASSEGSKIMPTKQFYVGEMKATEEEFEDTTEIPVDSEHH